MSQQPGILNGCRRQTLEQQWNCSGDTAALCSSTGLASGKICRYEYRGNERQSSPLLQQAVEACIHLLNGSGGIAVAFAQGEEQVGELI